MKLYANATSERASKGQGGNDFLTINIQAGKDRASILRFTVTAADDDSKYVSIKDIFFDGIWIASHFRNAYNDTRDGKGEKQKGESSFCPKCREDMKDEDHNC